MSLFFFLNDTATTEIYTLSLHDALPIYQITTRITNRFTVRAFEGGEFAARVLDREVIHQVMAEHAIRISDASGDRKSTRLNSSHSSISYAVFCLKKKKKHKIRYK